MISMEPSRQIFRRISLRLDFHELSIVVSGEVGNLRVESSDVLWQGGGVSPYNSL